MMVAETMNQRCREFQRFADALVRIPIVRALLSPAAGRARGAQHHSGLAAPARQTPALPSWINCAANRLK